MKKTTTFSLEYGDTLSFGEEVPDQVRTATRDLLVDIDGELVENILSVYDYGGGGALHRAERTLTFDDETFAVTVRITEAELDANVRLTLDETVTLNSEELFAA